jgi:hypothetical protein
VPSRGKIFRQAHIENQKRHGDAEDSVDEGIEAGLGRICAKNIKLFQRLACLVH